MDYTDYQGYADTLAVVEDLQEQIEAVKGEKESATQELEEVKELAVDENTAHTWNDVEEARHRVEKAAHKHSKLMKELSGRKKELEQEEDTARRDMLSVLQDKYLEYLAQQVQSAREMSAALQEFKELRSSFPRNARGKDSNFELLIEPMSGTIGKRVAGSWFRDAQRKSDG